MKKYDIAQLRSLPVDQLLDDEFIVAVWREDGIKVLDAIATQHTIPMDMGQFMFHCTTCGGDWNTMLLSGIEALYPEVYEAIPDDMGHFAWRCICSMLELLDIEPSIE